VGIAASGAVVFVVITTPLVLGGATCRGPVSRRDLFEVMLPMAMQSALAYGALTVQHRLGFTGLSQLVLATFTCMAVFALLGCFVPQQRRLAGRILLEARARTGRAIFRS
jgi:hypothetical protein